VPWVGATSAAAMAVADAPDVDEQGLITMRSAIDLVENEVQKWSCNNYMHITRAVGNPVYQIPLPEEGEEEYAGPIVLELETIFSKPTSESPVPTSCVNVYFFLDARTGQLTYQFEQENVQHRVGGQSLAYGKFEMWLDRIIGDKMQVRQLHDLATGFESTRLEPPVQESEPVSDADAELDQVAFTRLISEQPGFEQKDLTKRISSKQMAPLVVEEVTLTMGTLMANIFDAADEDEEFELTHKEVADLLYATPLGLADWDIKLLLTTAQELATGKIQYKPFVQAAPEIIEALLKRRASYQAREQPNMQVTHEAIDLCYGEEIEEIGRAAREAFNANDAGGKGTLSRHEFRTCLLSRSERFSMQEVQLLMQMCKEDDFGQVPYDDFTVLLEQLRIDSLHNALVETDVESLRVHLILLLRREGLQQDPVLPVWCLRNVLLAADQLCLSRMQIHVILSIVHPSEHGEVDVEYFLRVACTVIPYMFDAATFMDKASTIAKEKADALAKAEAEELQGLTASSLAAKRRTDEDEGEDVQANAPDRDAVEKALIHNAGQYDEKHRQQPTLHVRKFIEAMHHESVQQLQLSEAELRGFIAEADIDERDEIGYIDHIKMWVPIIFELRKSRVYDSILAKDWGLDNEHLIDLSRYEATFPLLPSGDDADTRGQRRPSLSRNQQRRPSRGRHSMSRSSTKGAGERDAIEQMQRRGTKERGARPSSAKRGKDQEEAVRSQTKESKDSRPRSRDAQKKQGKSPRSLKRTDSDESVSSRASVCSYASYASHKSGR